MTQRRTYHIELDITLDDDDLALDPDNQDDDAVCERAGSLVRTMLEYHPFSHGITRCECTSLTEPEESRS